MIRCSLYQIFALLSLCAGFTDAFQRPNVASFPMQPSRNYAINIPSSVKVHPLNGNVLIKMTKAPQTGISGIIIPRNSFGFRRGRVVRVGQGKKNSLTGTTADPTVQPGDDIYYERNIGEPLIIHGEDYCIVDENDILLKCSKETPSVNEVHCLRDQLLVQLTPKTADSSMHTNQITYNTKNAIPSSGTVVRLGDALNDDRIRIGDRVHFSFHNGVRQLAIEGKQYVLIYLSDVLAKW